MQFLDNTNIEVELLRHNLKTVIKIWKLNKNFHEIFPFTLYSHYIIDFQIFFQSQCAKMGLCALNEKIEDPRCKLTDKNCGENMKFITINRSNRILTPFVYYFRFCIQQCKCAPNEYIEKDGKCFKNSNLVRCFIILYDWIQLPRKIRSIQFSDHFNYKLITMIRKKFWISELQAISKCQFLIDNIFIENSFFKKIKIVF